MKIIEIGCNCPNHGKIGMMDHPKNEDNLEYFIESIRKQGCTPIIRSYDDQLDSEIEK